MCTQVSALGVFEPSQCLPGSSSTLCGLTRILSDDLKWHSINEPQCPWLIEMQEPSPTGSLTADTFC